MLKGPNTNRLVLLAASGKCPYNEWVGSRAFNRYNNDKRNLKAPRYRTVQVYLVEEKKGYLQRVPDSE